ncbi:hypothetical protein [Nocardiopsis sp. CC223A]|uniref:hypothetical protein n=1 Tax=Nocardiopsis sp. CC223A TaxID=3044051 RepID=UPI00278C6C3E|nr:hypothetical protein [Nocardiopsis sp. CC223A]
MKNAIASRLSLFTSTSLAAALMSVGVSSASPMPSARDLDVLGSSQGNGRQSGNLTAEVNQAENNSQGNLLSVTWSIENTGTERVVLTWLEGKTYTYSGANYAGVTITQSNGGTRYHPVMDGSGECLCSGDNSSTFRERIEPGEKISYWSMFSVPTGVERISVEIPGFDPIEDIPIS